MASTLIINDIFTWMPTGGVFDLTVEEMGRLMKNDRPDLSEMFCGASSEVLGWSYLDISSLSLVDKRYVLDILIQFRKQLSKESVSNPEKYNYARLDKRLSEFEDLLKKAIE